MAERFAEGCSKCGRPDPWFARVTYPDPLCVCGQRKSEHQGPRGACSFADATGSCKCLKFTAAAERPGGREPAPEDRARLAGRHDRG